MTSEQSDMDELDERVRHLLEEAEERVGSLDPDEGIDEEAAEEFEDIPGRVNELLSSTDPTDLLDAVGPTDLSQEEPPETIPEAIEKSDPETVVTLRKLLTLSKMDEGDDGDTFAEYVGEFRELSDVWGDVPEAEDEGQTEVGETSETVEEAPEGVSTGGGSDSESETDYAERLRETLKEGIDEFRDGIDRTRAGLEAESGTETRGAEGGSDRSEAGEGTMFSTIPSHDRVDMKGTARFSTVRKKRNDGE